MDSPKKRCAKYIGVPYKIRGDNPITGWDCWGLVHYVGMHEFGFLWPSYEEAHKYYNGSPTCAARIINSYLGDWKLIENGEPGDVVCFSTKGKKSNLIFHVGLILNSFEMIHVIRYNKGTDDNTRISRFDSFEWQPFFNGIRRKC